MVNVGILVCNQFLFVVVCCCLLLNVRSATCDEALSPRLSVFFPAFVIQLVGGFWFFGVLHLYLHPTLHPFSTHFPSIFAWFSSPSVWSLTDRQLLPGCIFWRLLMMLVVFLLSMLFCRFCGCLASGEKEYLHTICILFYGGESPTQ